MNNQGFVALILVMIITAGIGLSMTPATQEIFNLRSFILRDRERKHLYNLAFSCLDIAAVRLAADKSYSGNQTLEFETATCTILPIVPTTPETVLKIRLAANSFTISLQGIFNESTFIVHDKKTLPNL